MEPHSRELALHWQALRLLGLQSLNTVLP